MAHEIHKMQRTMENWEKSKKWRRFELYVEIESYALAYARGQIKKTQASEKLYDAYMARENELREPLQIYPGPMVRDMVIDAE